MVSSRPGPESARARSPLALMGVGGVLAVALRDNADVGHQVSKTRTTSEAVPSGPDAVAGFGSPDTDLFGRRVDVPSDPAGVALQQNPAAQQQPDTPGWSAVAPAPVTGEGVWQRIFGGPVVRFSASDGPARIDGSAAVGFAHTPQGAALAAGDWKLATVTGEQQVQIESLRSIEGWTQW